MDNQSRDAGASAHQMDPWTESVIEQNRAWLTAYVLSLIGDPVARDDIVQDVFLTAYRMRDRFERGTNFGGWLRQIARNLCMRHLRARGRQPIWDHELTMKRLEDAAAALEHRDVDPNGLDRARRFLRECLDGLSRKVRQLVHLRYTSSKTTAEITRATGMSSVAIDTALFRARVALAECVARREATT